MFSVEGAPENRAGKSSVVTHLPCSRGGSGDPSDQGANALCSPPDPFDQGVVATDEVKEEPPEPFQKIGPSMQCFLGRGLGGDQLREAELSPSAGRGGGVSHLQWWQPPVSWAE